MREVSAVGGPVVLAAVTAAAGVLLAILRRHWGPAVAAAVTVAGSAVLTVVFKQALGRPRPPLAGAVAAADGYAFPSAHAAVAAAAFGVLAYLSARRAQVVGGPGRDLGHRGGPGRRCRHLPRLPGRPLDHRRARRLGLRCLLGGRGHHRLDRCPARAGGTFTGPRATLGSAQPGAVRDT